MINFNCLMGQTWDGTDMLIANTIMTTFNNVNIPNMNSN